MTEDPTHLDRVRPGMVFTAEGQTLPHGRTTRAVNKGNRRRTQLHRPVRVLTAAARGTKDRLPIELSGVGSRDPKPQEKCEAVNNAVSKAVNTARSALSALVGNTTSADRINPYAKAHR